MLLTWHDSRQDAKTNLGLIKLNDSFSHSISCHWANNGLWSKLKRLHFHLAGCRLQKKNLRWHHLEWRTSRPDRPPHSMLKSHQSLQLVRIRYFRLLNGTVGHNMNIWKFRNVCTCNLQVQGGFTLVKSAKKPFLCIAMGNLMFAMLGQC